MKKLILFLFLIVTSTTSHAQLGIGTYSFTPTASLHVIGTGTTSSTYALKLFNSISTPILAARNDGQFQVYGNLVSSPQALSATDGWNTILGVSTGNGTLFLDGTNPTTASEQRGIITGDAGLRFQFKNSSGVDKIILNSKASNNRMQLISDDANSSFIFFSTGVATLLSAVNNDALNIQKDNSGTTPGTTYSALSVLNTDATANRLAIIGFTHSQNVARHGFIGARYISSTAGELFLGTKTGGVEAIAITIDQNQNVGIGTSSPGHLLELSADDAAKPSTSTWSVVSDIRLKKDTSTFTDGLNIVRNIRPINFKYNGLAGTPSNDSSCIGISAQHMQIIAPYTIKQVKKELKGSVAEEFPYSKAYLRTDTVGSELLPVYEANILTYNPDALFYLLVNSVKELDRENATLQAQVATLQQRITVLEQR